MWQKVNKNYLNWISGLGVLERIVLSDRIGLRDNEENLPKYTCKNQWNHKPHSHRIINMYNLHIPTF